MGCLPDKMPPNDQKTKGKSKMGREEVSLKVFKIILLAVLIVEFSICSVASAESLRVGSAPSDNYTSVQAAIDASEPEDTIFVNPGIYIENLKIDKQVRIWSESRNPEDTIITAADPDKNTVEITADRVSFSGFGVEGSNNAGISLSGVKDCFINNNRVQEEEYGILLKNAVTNKISDNFLVLNEKGIKLENSDSNTVQDNIIAYNYGSGISLEESRKNMIYNNFLKNADNVEKQDVNSENIWQSPLITKQNIVRGPYIGGNFWAGLGGKGYSETCKDENNNGICDASYNLNGGGMDKSPLYPKVPNAVKTIENELSDSASSYKEGMKIRETSNGVNSPVNDTNGTNESSGKNTTNENASEEETPGPGLEVLAISAGAAYFLRQRR